MRQPDGQNFCGLTLAFIAVVRVVGHVHVSKFIRAHLSKGASDLKQKCTQFIMLFHRCDSFYLECEVEKPLSYCIGWNSSTANQKLPFQGFQSSYFEQNRSHNVKQYEKLWMKMVSQMVYKYTLCILFEFEATCVFGKMWREQHSNSVQKNA